MLLQNCGWENLKIIKSRQWYLTTRKEIGTNVIWMSRSQSRRLHLQKTLKIDIRSQCSWEQERWADSVRVAETAQCKKKKRKKKSRMKSKSRSGFLRLLFLYKVTIRWLVSGPELLFRPRNTDLKKDPATPQQMYATKFPQYTLKGNTALTWVTIAGKGVYPTISKTFRYWAWGIIWGNYGEQVINDILLKSGSQCVYWIRASMKWTFFGPNI